MYTFSLHHKVSLDIIFFTYFFRIFFHDSYIHSLSLFLSSSVCFLFSSSSIRHSFIPPFLFLSFTYQQSLSIHSCPLILSSRISYLLFFSSVFCRPPQLLLSLQLIVPLVSFRSRFIRRRFPLSFALPFPYFSNLLEIAFPSRPRSALPSFFRPRNGLRTSRRVASRRASLGILARFNFLRTLFAFSIYPFYSNRVLSASTLHFRTLFFLRFLFFDFPSDSSFSVSFPNVDSRYVSLILFNYSTCLDPLILSIYPFLLLFTRRYTSTSRATSRRFVPSLFSLIVRCFFWRQRRAKALH